VLRARMAELAPILRRIQAMGHMPGAPMSALVALTASSAGVEEFGGAPDHTRGMYAVERATVQRYAREGVGRRWVGRDVELDAQGEPQWRADLELQCLYGLVRYDELRLAMVRAIGVELASPLAVDAWTYQLAVAAYTSGTGAAVTVVNHVRDQLARVTVEVRGSAWATSTATAIERHESYGSVRVDGRGGVAWTIVRARQRYECGRLLANDQHESLAWYTDPPLTDAVDRALRAAANVW
jgi:hypothetical protein